MTNRIFRAIFLVAAAVMLAVSLLTMGMMYQFSAEETTEKLQRETEYIACGIETDGVRYLEKIKDADTRITWVDADGTACAAFGSETRKYPPGFNRSFNSDRTAAGCRRCSSTSPQTTTSKDCRNRG